MPTLKGPSEPAKAMSTNPAAFSTVVAKSVSASPKGPGAPGGGTGRSRPTARASRIAVIHSLAAKGCQTRIARRPPGRSAEPMFVKAATGSAKNITPKRLMATSKAPGRKGWTWASPCSKRMVVRPSASADCCARASIGPDRSTASTDPPAAAARAASRLVAPLPQPTSSTRSPGAMAAAAMSRAWWGRIEVSKRSWWAAQYSPSGPSQAAACSTLTISLVMGSFLRTR